MKIIDPCYTILRDLDTIDPVVRIESCGRICYKSEDRISPASAVPFVKGIVKHGHNSVLEMAACSLRVMVETDSLVSRFFCQLPKYLQIDQPEKKELIISGTMRAFRELIQAASTVQVVKAIAGFMAERYPVLFKDLEPGHGWTPQMGVAVDKISLADVDAMPAHLLARHRHVAVKFVVNRAVTHEIVRHRPCSFLQESQRYCRYSEDKFGNEVTFIRPLFYEEKSPEFRLWLKAMEETEKVYLELLQTSTPQAARTVLPNSCKTELIVFCTLAEWGHIFRLRTTQAAEPSMREVMLPLLHEMAGLYPQVFESLASQVALGAGKESAS